MPIWTITPESSTRLRIRIQQVHYILTTVYESLKEKGYDPINQIVGYILSEDPTYITNHNSARTLICKMDRDELLQAAGEELSGHRLMPLRK